MPNLITGTNGNDFLTGSAGDDYIDGGPGPGPDGIDTMIGGLGNDSYTVDTSSDVVIEKAGEGIDVVAINLFDNRTFNYTIPENTENLYYSDIAGNTNPAELKGNKLDNEFQIAYSPYNLTVHAGDGNDIINDTSIGGPNSLYGDDGNDYIRTRFDDSIYGGAGNDTLAGGGDSFGGAGNDTYTGTVFDSSQPTTTYLAPNAIFELPNEGFDEIFVRANFVAPDNIESISLGGYAQTSINATSGNFNLTANNQGMYMYGNAGNNVLTGGTGNDTITSGLGVDIMTGGAGDDTYYLRDLGDETDTIVEQANGGRDSVWTYVDNATLADNVEVLNMVGSNVLQGNGGAGNNTIFSNARDNVIDGKAGNDGLYDGPGGNDTLRGGSGSDRLFIESGNDVVRFGVGDDYDVIRSFDQTGYDLLKIDGVDESQIWFSMSGTDLNIDLIGRNDGITVSLWAAGKDFQIDAIQLQNGHILSADKIGPLVSAMSNFTPPAAGQTTLPTNYQRELGAAITQAWG